MAKRLTVRVSDELGEQVQKYAQQFGVTQSQFGGMCVQAGLGTILRAVKPEESIPAETLARIIQEVQKLSDQETEKIIQK